MTADVQLAIITTLGSAFAGILAFLANRMKINDQVANERIGEVKEALAIAAALVEQVKQQNDRQFAVAERKLDALTAAVRRLDPNPPAEP